MPRIRRAKLPEPLLRHSLIRMRERGISYGQLTLLAKWLDTEPEVAKEKWFKKFDGFVVCGEGELIRTFLVPGQAVQGEEVM